MWLWSLLLAQLVAGEHIFGRRPIFNSTINSTSTSDTSSSTRRVTASIISTEVIQIQLANATAPASAASFGSGTDTVSVQLTNSTSENAGPSTETIQLQLANSTADNVPSSTETIQVQLANATTSAIRGTGTGFISHSMNTTNTVWSSVSSCNEALLSWSSANRYTITSYTTQITYQWSTSTGLGNQSVYYEPCDVPQWPRVNGPASVYRVATTDTYAVYEHTVITSNATAAKPTCTINSAGCQYILSSYSSLSSFPGTVGYEVDLPCTSTCRYAIEAPDFPVCTFSSPAQVRLIYFPVTTANVTGCGNYSTIPPATPATVESLGTTFTEGTAYISFAGLAAYDGCTQLTGSSIGNTILALPSSEVSYLCGEYGLQQFGPLPTQLNFADLNYPIPLSLYTCQERCLYGESEMNVWQTACPTVLDTFAPALG
jgi:hypothetical protein